jgi:hypothetical protein
MSESKRISNVVCFDQTSGGLRRTVCLNQRAIQSHRFCKSQFDVGGDLKIATPCTQGIVKWPQRRDCRLRRSSNGGSLYSIGIPKDSIIAYESAVKADGFLVMTHGSAAEVDRAKKTLEPLHPSRIDVHEAPGVAPLAGHVG